MWLIAQLLQSWYVPSDCTAAFLTLSLSHRNASQYEAALAAACLLQCSIIWYPTGSYSYFYNLTCDGSGPIMGVASDVVAKEH